ncbi:helix-turn-helix domain-containing protein [Ruminococcus bicirculans (ex Wegman et al. 2014)]|uniref:helix-turn-helix domain-containing protein n=1 Tax=Ruminococcus TaxID=1263 RepID=UPI0039A2085C|nr:helix-turn-helix transcriptional regulator [Ruminococcus sp.]
MENYYFQRLKDLREDKDLNQAQVAEIIGTTQQYYGQYETGKRPIPFDRIIKLAKFYNVSIDYIAGLTNDKGGLHNNVQSKYNITQKNSPKAVIKIKEEK